MKTKLIFLLLMFGSVLHAQNTGQRNKAKIDSVLASLNEWDINELDLYERPQAYPKNYITSGETNGWIDTHKEELKELGAEVIWDGKKKRYFLKPE